MVVSRALFSPWSWLHVYIMHLADPVQQRLFYTAKQFESAPVLFGRGQELKPEV